MKIFTRNRIVIALLVLATPLVLLGSEKQDLCLTFCEDGEKTASASTDLQENEGPAVSNENPATSDRPVFRASRLIQRSDAIVCNLAPAEQIERKESIRSDILSRTLSRKRTEDAWVLSFPEDPELLTTLMEYIQLEKACCSFLSFELIVKPHAGGTQLKLGGAPEAIDFLGQFMTETGELAPS